MNEADRKAFLEWYDRAIDDDGRMEPIDVWEAALQHARSRADMRPLEQMAAEYANNAVWDRPDSQMLETAYIGGAAVEAVRPIGGGSPALTGDPKCGTGSPDPARLAKGRLMDSALQRKPIEQMAQEAADKAFARPANSSYSSSNYIFKHGYIAGYRAAIGTSTTEPPTEPGAYWVWDIDVGEWFILEFDEHDIKQQFPRGRGTKWQRIPTPEEGKT